MKTTNSFYSGKVRDEHRWITGSIFEDGYIVEDKGLIFLDVEEAIRLQNMRFDKDPTLIRIDIMEPGQKTIKLLRNQL